MVLGVLRACQKVMEDEIFSSINPFKHWFFQTKKRSFFESLGPKNDPNMLFRVVGSKNPLEQKKYRVHDPYIDSVKV